MRFLEIRLKLYLVSPKKKDSLSFEKFFAISWCLSVLLPSPFRDTRFPFLVSCAAPSIFPLPPFVLFVTAHSTPLAFLPFGLPFNLTLSLLLAPAISRFISLLFSHLLLLSLSLSLLGSEKVFLRGSMSRIWSYSWRLMSENITTKQVSYQRWGIRS